MKNGLTTSLFFFLENGKKIGSVGRKRGKKKRMPITRIKSRSNLLIFLVCFFVCVCFLCVCVSCLFFCVFVWAVVPAMF